MIFKSLMLITVALVILLTVDTTIAYAREGTMQITSPIFFHNQSIPRVYTCQGKNINPPLTVSGIPKGTVSLVLINDDPDAPGATWDHWIVYDINPAETIAEDSVPGTQGKNSWGKNSYGGPCPPSGTHRYFFKIYAIDTKLNLPEGATKQKVENAMKGHILGHAEMVGLYQRI